MEQNAGRGLHQPRTFSESLRIPVEPSMKLALKERADAAGVTLADAARQLLAQGLGTVELRDADDAELARSLLSAVSGWLVRAQDLSTAEDTDLSESYRRLQDAVSLSDDTDGSYSSDEDRADARREAAIATCERLAGLAAGIADVLALIRQPESPAFAGGEMAYEFYEASTEANFIAKIVAATAERYVREAEASRLGQARERLLALASRGGNP